MKNIAKTFGLIALVAAFGSCDKIEGPYIQQDESVASTVVFPDINVDTVTRKVLIEEYTGHKCSNCPGGHREMENLSEAFGNQLIGISIHAGTLANPNAGGLFVYDFRTDEGTELYSDFAVPATPAAVINRAPYEGGYALLNLPDWRNAINAVDQQQVVAALQLINQYDANAKSLTANAKVTVKEDYDGRVNLTFYVTEDRIIKPQQNGEARDTNYVHNHVMRGSLNGTYGTALTPEGTVVRDSAYTKAYRVSLEGKDWNPANCSIVAILTNADTKEVLQVEKCPFINSKSAFKTVK